MANKQQVQNCIQQCVQAANTLRAAANNVPDSAVRDMLTQGAHHIEQCVRGCEQVMQMA
ncbi:hypothetical protein [Caldinitratiruptor microaerophilus]|uniref:Uncharacterized protein n=1 Tax=Caldinitratiruptor microaerophilus TaxID=671077 RepID=A0AA35CNZ2_9FIRM|nr:hypothetical protein [Caldinitratiruptor microaerophilus]BDG61167.1 hypothetical protein caldi_22570 [Caldinitratiruptor microaerophilus]